MELRVALSSLLLTLGLAPWPSPAASPPSPLPPPRVYRDRVEPHWFANNTRLWYRVETPGGRHEFVVVDVDPPARYPAFQHSRVADALARATGKPVDAGKLPIDSLAFETNAPAILLRGELGTWRWNTENQSLESAGTEDDADTLPADSEPRASARTGPESAITFDNRRPAAVELFWMSPEGRRVSYGTLPPGAQKRQHTFAGHVWIATEAGRVVAVFEAERTPRRALIRTGEPARRATRDESSKPAPTFVPSPDGRWEAFVRDHNLWIRHAESRSESALSFDGSAGNSFRKDVQRDRLMGMEYDKPEPPPSLPEVVWSPDSRKLIALQTRSVPERRVTLVESSPTDQLQPRTSSYPYLKAGDAIPTQRPRLFLVEPARECVFSDDLFPNPWSLDEFRWEPDSSRFTFLDNERGHQRLRVLAVTPRPDDSRRADVLTLVDEQSDTFIDYSNKTHLHFLESARQLLWMTERSGWNHLLLIDSTNGKVLNPITQGDWVVRGVEHLDEPTRRLWIRVMGVRPGEDPYHVHLARVNLDGSGFTLLTEGDGTHQIQWSPDRRHFLDTWSRVDLPPITELRRADDGTRVCLVEEADAREVLERRGRFPQRFVAPGRDGQTLIHGILHWPPDAQPGQRYPVIENIYAGPHDQHVPKAFRASFRHQHELVDRGFVVVQIDGMGTNWRSKKFHDFAARNIGDAGFPDRIAWLQAAARQFPELDLKRVGIYGGSAGGQNALRALLAHGDFYHAAVADCGCHDNRMDKIWWNEAWMGWPVGPHYVEQSNVTQAHRLQGRLMLVVGELDRNVDPASTTQVVNALVKADKDFDFVLIPGTGHGAAESDYGRRRRAEFFERHLR